MRSGLACQLKPHKDVWTRVTLVQVSVAAFLSQDEQNANPEVDDDARGAQPPDDGVSDQVYLGMVFDPEVLHGQL
jgi:hypothetical protein